MADRLGENLKQRLWADHQSDDDTMSDQETSENSPLSSRLAQWVGGLVSLALVLGVVYWVYELGRRDANEVPVIQAMGGVARDVPEDSGGTIVDHQGLQVNEVLGGDNTAPVEPETRLAPPPQRVVPEDTQTAPPVTPESVPVPEPAEDPAAPVEETFTLPPSLPGADPDMTRPERRVQRAGLSPNADILSQAIANAISEVANEGAGADAEVAPESPTVAPAPPAAAEFSGEKMIQLGAYDAEDSAIRDWDMLVANNLDLMAGLTRFIERREAGGRVFYRLRARGFADMDSATDMCTALLARDVQCIAVTAR